MFTNPALASIAASRPLRFEPPENPAKATGHFAVWGHSLRTASNAAPNMPNRHGVESWRGLIVASDARIIHPSVSAGGRYHSASIGLVRWKSVVDVTMRMGQRRAGSKPGGNVRTARPVSTLGLPP